MCTTTSECFNKIIINDYVSVIQIYLLDFDNAMEGVFYDTTMEI